jgi:hypothetical protein
MARWIAALLVFSFAFAGIPDAHAQESPTEEQARNLFTAGQNAFQSGDYASAADYFEQAYALSHRPGLLYNIAFAADRNRDDARALEAYRAYLVAEWETSRRAEVEARITFLEAALAEAARAEAEAAAAAAAAAELASRPPPEPERFRGFHPAGVVTLVSGGVLLASFGIFAGLSEVEDQQLARSCGRDAGASCAPASVVTLQTLNTLADVSWIAGAAVAVTGIVLLFAVPPDSPQPSLAMAPWFTPDGAGATMVGQW